MTIASTVSFTRSILYIIVDSPLHYSHGAHTPTVHTYVPKHILHMHIDASTFIWCVFQTTCLGSDRAMLELLTTVSGEFHKCVVWPKQNNPTVKVCTLGCVCLCGCRCSLSSLLKCMDSTTLIIMVKTLNILYLQWIVVETEKEGERERRIRKREESEGNRQLGRGRDGDKCQSCTLWPPKSLC